MLTANPVFVEKTEYAYAVARVRALETKLVDQAAFSTLLAAAPDKLSGALAEAARFKTAGAADPELLLNGLEESFTQTFNTVKALLLEDPLKRLVSLKYDYEIVKIIAKEEMGGASIGRPRKPPRSSPGARTTPTPS
jgi:vacuolar-type H+-ATPase subunit C/Vma6